MDEDQLVCYGCGLIFPTDQGAWVEDGDDLAAACPDCGSRDIQTYETYLDGM